jgi:hypothetical protein
MGGNQFLGAFEGVGPEISTFLGPNGTSIPRTQSVMIQLYNTALALSTNFPYSSLSPSRTQPSPPRHAVLVHGVQPPGELVLQCYLITRLASLSLYAC